VMRHTAGMSTPGLLRDGTAQLSDGSQDGRDLWGTFAEWNYLYLAIILEDILQYGELVSISARVGLTFRKYSQIVSS